MISQLFNRAAHKNGERIVVVDGERHMTYFELQVYVEWAARYFQSLGIQPGHRIAIYIPNQHEFVISLLGMWPLGGVAVPLPECEEPEALRALLLAAKVHAVITIPLYREFLVAALTQSETSAWPLHKIPLAVFEEDNIATAKGTLPPPEAKVHVAPRGNDDGDYQGIGLLSNLVGRFETHTAMLCLQTASSDAQNFKPYTHAAVVEAAENFARSSQIATDDCILAVLPFSYAASVIHNLLAVFVGGAKVILLPGFDEVLVGEILVGENVTVYCDATAHFEQLDALAETRAALDGLRLQFTFDEQTDTVTSRARNLSANEIL